MNKRINYNILIDVIKEKGNVIIDQKLTKKLLKDELPKSCFIRNYLKNGKNELGRFLMNNSDVYIFEIIPAQIKVTKIK